jgi:cell division transport system permease protein
MMARRDRPQARWLAQSRATRPMLWIMAIMLFLTVLAAAAGIGVAGAARLVDRQIAGRLTVQIVEASEGRRDAQAAAALAALRASPAVHSAEPVDRAELVRLIRPWMGDDASDPDLPIPALIDADFANASDAAVNAVSAQVHAVAPEARIDRHERWMAPVARLMRALVWLAVGLVALMATATAAVVLLAARAGLDMHRDTISVLHMLGSTDVQVARLFQRRIARDTLLGGAVGTVLAILVLLLLGRMAGAMDAALLQGASLGPIGWAVLALLPVGFALLATAAARVAVTRALRRVL